MPNFNLTSAKSNFSPNGFKNFLLCLPLEREDDSIVDESMLAILGIFLIIVVKISKKFKLECKFKIFTIFLEVSQILTLNFQP